MVKSYTMMFIPFKAKKLRMQHNVQISMMKRKFYSGIDVNVPRYTSLVLVRGNRFSMKTISMLIIS